MGVLSSGATAKVADLTVYCRGPESVDIQHNFLFSIHWADKRHVLEQETGGICKRPTSFLYRQSTRQLKRSRRLLTKVSCSGCCSSGNEATGYVLHNWSSVKNTLLHATTMPRPALGTTLYNMNSGSLQRIRQPEREAGHLIPISVEA
jgi:hypothetical protein